MKRSTLIFIGIAIILLLFGFWIYSFLYGTPQKAGDIFANFGLFGNEASEFPPDIDIIPEEQPVVDVATAKLRQLTTRPVIGFYESYSTSSEPGYIVYAESGTGHIYEINLVTGEENRISNITVPSAFEASFDQNGNFVAIRSGYTSQGGIVLINTREKDKVTSTAMPYQNVGQFHFDKNGLLLFTLETAVGTTGYQLDPFSNVRTQLFTLPFHSSHIVWSEHGDTPLYVYPKPTALLTGYVYEISSGKTVRMPLSGGGLMMESGRDHLSYTFLFGETYQSRLYTIATGEVLELPIIIIPEKCVLSKENSDKLYCGHESTEYSYQFPDDWYKGTRSFNDTLWEVDLSLQSATELINPVM